MTVSIKQALLNNIKNVRGWRTPRKLVAFAVDDYGSVRLDSKKALKNLRGASLNVSSHFDQLDTVETRQDLDGLFETLESFRDLKGNAPVFTAYALSANPDFQRIRTDGQAYHYESVRDTFSRLASDQADGYEGAWELWQEGMARNLIRPQFHGREHVSVDLLEHKLRLESADLQVNLANNSLAALTPDPALPGVGFTQSFGIHTRAQLTRHASILTEGLDLFEQVWGFRSTTFTPPAGSIHPSLYDVAVEGGVRAIHKPLHVVRNLGDGAMRREVNRSGQQKGDSHVSVVRNVVFEPVVNRAYCPVDHSIAQISAAFRWGKPAVISSHRVNFCGHIEEDNRSRGLGALRKLLAGITERWPDVEFVSVDRLVSEMGFDE